MAPANASQEGNASNAPSGPEAAARPTLPPNVSIFSPPAPSPAAVSGALLGGKGPRIFTRLTIAPSPGNHTRTPVVETLKKRPELAAQECWLVHQDVVVLVFDATGENANDGDGEDEETLKDRHHEHVRSVCLALKDGDLSLSIAGCVFDAKDAVGAGFQFDRLSGGAVLVVDLMDGGDDEDDDEEEGGSNDGDDDDEDFDLLAGAETVA